MRVKSIEEFQLTYRLKKTPAVIGVLDPFHAILLKCSIISHAIEGRFVFFLIIQPPIRNNENTRKYNIEMYRFVKNRPNISILWLVTRQLEGNLSLMEIFY